VHSRALYDAPVKRCPACGEENADRARFCHSCATPLSETEERSGEVRKVVTVIFADVTGSTALGGRLDPEALRRVMGRYFDEMSAVIERHGGIVEKFIGDAVMAVFGIPRLHEDDALRAVRAASDMRAALETLNLDLERDHGVEIAARIGVNTGEVVAGDPSSGQRLVTGDAVNVAARLEQAASPGEILIGEATHRLVRDAVEAEPVVPLDLKGKDEPVPAYRLTGLLQVDEGHARRLDSPMVGRAKELEMLERALERAVDDRTSQLFTLLGPAGVGKSRLVKEFLQGPAAEATLLRGRCLSYGEGITFYPLAEVVQEAAGVSQTDDLATAREKLTSLVADAEERDRIVPLVAGLVSWDEAVATEEAFWGVRKLLEHLARDRPVVVVFDDIHWAEPTFLDLIEHLADWTRGAALLLVCVARSELLEVRPGWGGGKMNATSILLEPLDVGTASELVDNLLGRADIPTEARSRILDAAEGNPLFVEEMLGMLIDDGLLKLEGETWRAVEDLAQITVPPTIQLLLAARLDRLDAEERAVIERGSVEGKVFHTGAVTTLAPETLRPHVPSRLLALARKELIRPDRAEFAGEDAFRFRHLLIRDAAYQAMPKEQRADLHERFAEWLERAAGERAAEYEEILAHHLEQAYRYRIELGTIDDRTRALGGDAAAHLRRSADRALDRGDFAGARQMLTRAAEISEGGLRALVLIELAIALDELQDYSGAAQVADEAIAVAEVSDDRAYVLRAAVIRTEARGQFDPTHTLARTRREVDEALEKLRAIGDDDGIVLALLSASRMAFFTGRCDRSREICEQLLERAARLPSRFRREIGIQLAVASYYGAATVEEAHRLGDIARSLQPESLLQEATTGIHHVGVLAMEGREEDFDREIERVKRLWDEIGDPTRIVTRAQGLGEGYRLLGRPELAEKQFRAGMEAFDQLGETGFNSTMTALLALSLCDQGRFVEAETYVARSRELGAEDDFATQSAWRIGGALVRSHRGDHDGALSLADQAVAIIADTDYLVWQGDVHEVRGMVLANAGRRDEAQAAFQEAMSRYERKGVVPAVARIRERLADLEIR
jgi:class 3 adenylate cyclase/tetratricopeptide (TPR) repeat protein